MHQSRAKTEYRLALAKEVEAARWLVLQEYRRKGYVSDEGDLPLSRWLGQGLSDTVVAVREGEVLGTVSLVYDSTAGLPMDCLYRPEINCLRDAGKRVAEVSQLAISQSHVGSLAGRLQLVLSLFKSVLGQALGEEVTTLCIAVNPKHEWMYDNLGFTPLGPLRDYSSVNGAPAIAKQLDITAYGPDKIRHPLLRRIASRVP